MAIYKDGKRGTYYFIVRVKTREGKTKQVKRRGFKSNKEARLAEAEFLLDWEKGEVAEENITFKQVAEEYLEGYKIRRKHSSYRKMRGILRNHLIPQFGNKQIKNIRNRDVTKYHGILIESEKSPSYIKKIHSILSTIFRYAIKQEYTNHNPAAAVGNVDLEEEKHINYWTLEEFKQFISVVDDHLYKTMFMLLYYSGLRKGEMLALTWNDIDFDNNMININKTAYSQVVTTTKTRGSTRRITIPGHTIRLLSQLKASVEYYKTEYVVFGEFNKHIGDTVVNKYFNHYIEKAKVKKIRVHDLRHSHASYLINNGAIISVVSHRLGHDNTSTTLNIYSHLYPSKEKEIVSLMEDDFKKAKVYKFNQ